LVSILVLSFYLLPFIHRLHKSIRTTLCTYIQGVSGGVVNILGSRSMDYSEKISSYKHVSNFQWMWRYSCLNVTHKNPYKRYEEKTNDILIAFIGYVNDLNKLQQFKVSVQKPHHRLQCTFQTLLATVRVALLRSSWRSCFMSAALFIMRATNSSLVFTFSL